MKSALRSIAVLTVCLWAAFFAFSMAFWWLYPYPPNAPRETVVLIWSVHVLVEKGLGFLFSVAIAVDATLKARKQLGEYCILVGAVAGIPFHALVGSIYIYRFGLEAFIANSQPVDLLLLVMSLSVVASAIAFEIARRRDAQQGVPADRTRPAGESGG